MADWNNMLFHEVYGSYYQAVAKILSRAVQGNLTREGTSETVRQYAFGESWGTLTRALMDGDWPFLDSRLKTELKYEPRMPLTTLQKRWLKSMLEDPRIRLFLDPETVTGLESVEPLFRQEDVCYFDRYTDADPYEDPGYIDIFRTVLHSLREGGTLELTSRNRWGTETTQTLVPLYLEYSPRDDKFRLHSAPTAGEPRYGTIQTNLARIRRCRIVTAGEARMPEPAQTQKAELILSDRRDLLERFMRLFCWLRKHTVPMEPEGDTPRYRVTLYYEKSDEPEMLIRLLSLGSDLQILAPDSLRQELLRRVRRQRELLEK